MIPSLSAAVADYLSACDSKGLSEYTIDGYRHVLRALLDFMGDPYLDDIQPGDVRAFFGGMIRQSTRFRNHPQRREIAGGLKSSTINQQATVARQFFIWCKREYLHGTDHDPLRNVDKPQFRAEDEQPRACSDEDLIKLLNACDSTPLGTRNYALLCFLIDTGCRSGGLRGLTRDRLRLDDLQATVVEKGKRTRAVFFSPETAAAIRRWLNVAPPDAETIFCAMSPFYEGLALTGPGLNTILKQLGKAAGVTGPVNPHSFRHHLGVSWAARGGDSFILQRILGHTKAQMTARYTIPTNEQKAEIYARLSPLQHLMEEKDRKDTGQESGVVD